MKKKEIVRQIDETGRIVLPKPFREIIGVNIKDNVVISLGENEIIIRKQSNTCRICGNESAYEYKDAYLCKECAEDIASFINRQ